VGGLGFLEMRFDLFLVVAAIPLSIPLEHGLEFGNRVEGGFACPIFADGATPVGRDESDGDLGEFLMEFASEEVSDRREGGDGFGEQMTSKRRISLRAVSPGRSDARTPITTFFRPHLAGLSPATASA